jgi:hypothetical protein
VWYQIGMEIDGPGVDSEIDSPYLGIGWTV